MNCSDNFGIDFAHGLLQSDIFTRMKHLLTFLLFLSIGSLAWAQQLDTPLFTLSYPSDYQPKESDGTIAIEHKSGNTEVQLAIETSDGTVFEALRSFEEMMGVAVSATDAQKTLPADKLQQLGADSGGISTYFIEDEMVSMYQQVVCLKKGSRLYTLVFTCMTPQKAEFASSWQYVLDSFRLK